MEKRDIILTPREFEEQVKEFIEGIADEGLEFSSKLREKINGVEGGYEIDVSVRFKALGVNFLVLVECKHHKSPIKRDVVQLLYDKLRTTGAHKGIVFATTRFQSGAIDFAKSHGIALLVVSDGRPITDVKTILPLKVNFPNDVKSLFIKIDDIDKLFEVSMIAPEQVVIRSRWAFLKSSKHPSIKYNLLPIKRFLNIESDGAN